MFGDDIIDSEVPVLKQLIEEHEKHNCNVIGVGEVPDELIQNYGIVKYANENIVADFIEKPKLEEAPSNHALHGRLVLNSKLLSEVLNCTKHSNNEYYIPELLRNSDEELRAVKYDGTYYDIGSHVGYIKANIAYGLKKESIKKDLVEFIKNIGE